MLNETHFIGFILQDHTSLLVNNILFKFCNTTKNKDQSLQMYGRNCVVRRNENCT